MSAISSSATRPASVPSIPVSVGFWLVLALVLTVATACAFAAAVYVPDAAQPPFVGT
jgi:hypothetical protein